MRKYIHIVQFQILLLTTSCLGQSLNNAFFQTDHGGFNYEIFEFRKNNRFNYLSFTCNETSIGTGHYEVKDDSLYLNFEDSPKFNIHDVRLETGISDSISINIKVKDFTDRGLAYLYVSVLLDDGIVLKYNENSSITCKVKRKNFKRTLIITSVGYSKSEIEINPGVREVSGTIYLSNIQFFEPKKNLKFKIKHSSRNELKVYKNTDNEVVYKPIRKKLVDEVLKSRTGKVYSFFF